MEEEIVNELISVLEAILETGLPRNRERAEKILSVVYTGYEDPEE